MAFQHIRKLILAVALVANEQPRFSSVCALLRRRADVDTTNNSDQNERCTARTETMSDADVETGAVPVEGNEEISTKTVECPICCEQKESAKMHKCSTCKETSICEDCLEASVRLSGERKCPYCREENTYSFDGVQRVYGEVVSQMNREKYFRFAIVMFIGVFFQAIQFAFMVLDFKQIVNPEICDSNIMRKFPDRKCGSVVDRICLVPLEHRRCYCGSELENAQQACSREKRPMVMVRFGLIVFIVLMQMFSYQYVVNDRNPFARVGPCLTRCYVGRNRGEPSHTNTALPGASEVEADPAASEVDATIAADPAGSEVDLEDPERVAGPVAQPQP